MKRTSNPGHPNATQAEIPKAWKVFNSSDEDECHKAFHLNPNQAKADITVTIKGTPVQVIDSGATANTIDMQHIRRSVLQNSALNTNQCETSPSWRRQPCPDSLRWIVFRNDQYCVRADGPDQVPGTQSTKCWLSPDS